MSLRFKSIFILALSGLLGIFMILSTSEPAPAQAKIGIVVDGRELSPGPPVIVVENRTLVPVSHLSEALQAQAHWISEQRTVTVAKGGDVIQIQVGSKMAVKNGSPLDLGMAPRIIDERVFVPLRTAAEALGAAVNWDGKTQTISIVSGTEAAVPERVYSPAFPAQVAFTGNGYLWLVDGTTENSKPVQITHSGSVQIVGWSPGGLHLMYLLSPSREDYTAENYLWVVEADGTGARQVDTKPVDGVPAWSPLGDVIAYKTMAAGGKEADRNLKVAVVNGGKVEVVTLLPEGSGVFDFAWAPDGQSLAVSFPCTEDRSLRVDRVTLKGERTPIFSLGEAGMCGEPWAAQGFKWSPDGRYLAYHLIPQSASLAADGVTLQVLDLKKPGRPQELGCGLMYPEWLTWSSDSTKLAYILGEGREATVNKRLCIANMKDGKITDCSQDGQVDTQPVWKNAPPCGVVFCRGPETLTWEGQTNYQGVLVPGQRIWLKANERTAQPLTKGPADTADYAPNVSPDGQYLSYLRLNRRDGGSLYLKLLDGGKEVELLRGLSGDSGYYGNYYPSWVSICWKNSYRPLWNQVEELLARQYKFYRVLGKEITQQSINFNGSRVEAEYRIKVTTVLGVATPSEWPPQKGRIKFLEENRARLSPAVLQKLEKNIAFWQEELQGYIDTPSEAYDHIKVIAELDSNGEIKKDTVQFFREDPMGQYVPLDMNDLCFRTAEEMVNYGYEEMKQLAAEENISKSDSFVITPDTPPVTE